MFTHFYCSPTIYFTHCNCSPIQLSPIYMFTHIAFTHIPLHPHICSPTYMFTHIHVHPPYLSPTIFSPTISFTHHIFHPPYLSTTIFFKYHKQINIQMRTVQQSNPQHSPPKTHTCDCPIFKIAVDSENLPNFMRPQHSHIFEFCLLRPLKLLPHFLGIISSIS